MRWASNLGSRVSGRNGLKCRTRRPFEPLPTRLYAHPTMDASTETEQQSVQGTDEPILMRITRSGKMQNYIAHAVELLLVRPSRWLGFSKLMNNMQENHTRPVTLHTLPFKADESNNDNGKGKGKGKSKGKSGGQRHGIDASRLNIFQKPRQKRIQPPGTGLNYLLQQPKLIV